MIENIVDIETLTLRCRSDESKKYAAEAILCYKAGAFRAAIVSIWIAVVFDLIDKIRELSVSGDGAAKDLENKYETYISQIEQKSSTGIKNALEFERNILENCRDRLHFFDPQQFIDLARLREDRNRCAHPSFQKIGIPYYPSAEQARVHIRNAITHVLSQPPVQGKAALLQLKAIVSSDYFPIDKNKAAAQLESSGLMNATDALVRGLVDQLIFGFITKGDPLFLKNQVIAAINASFHLYPYLVESRLSKQLSRITVNAPDDILPAVAALVTFVEPSASILDQPSRDKIIAFIERGPSKYVLQLLKRFSSIESFQSAVQKRVDVLTLDELAEAIDKYDIGVLAKERAFCLLSEVRSWDRANQVLGKVVLPLFSYLSAEDIRRVIEMPTSNNADLPGAHAYKMFVDEVRKAGIINDHELNVLLDKNGASYLIPQPQTK